MKIPFISLLFYLAITARTLGAMERLPVNPQLWALSKLVKRVDHPVSIPGIAHYSVFRPHSVSTYINNESDLLPDANCYLTRTISCYPKEEVKEVFSGTKELPIYKISRIKTGILTYEDKIELIALENSPIGSKSAQDLFKHYVFKYNLFDKPADAWLDEINSLNPSSKPIAGSDGGSPMIKTNTQCNILG